MPAGSGASDIVTQVAVEIAYQPVVNARVTQVGVEVAYSSAAQSVVTQVGVEVAYIQVDVLLLFLDDLVLTTSTGGYGIGEIPPSPTTLQGVANLVSSLGHYYKAWPVGGRIEVRRGKRYQPPFITDATATPGPADTDPDLGELPDRRIILFFAASDGVAYVTSDDRGVTWSPKTMAIPLGKHGRSVEDIHGNRITFGVVGDAPTAQLQSTLQRSIDAAPGTPVVVVNSDGSGPLTVKDDAFGVTRAPDGTIRVSITLESESTPSDWWSDDRGQSLTRIV